MKSPNFFEELKRRNVIRMAGLYLVGAWLVVQVAGTVLPMFGAPDWLPRSIVILLAIGFVPAVVFSWVFELTPQGLKRDEDVPPEQSIGPQTGRRMDRMIIAVLVLALAYFAFDKFVLTPRRQAAVVTKEESSLPNDVNINPKSIAVLPFENLSDDKQNAYFADGIQEEILTKLASIADLKVISRTSAAKYKSKPENLKTVSQELGAAKILEGSVQRSGDKVRVNVQLIDARTDSHMWAKSYDGDAKDIFGVETEVSQQVADALRAKLSPQEAKTLAKAPTQDPEAYDLFLRAEAQARAALAAITGEAFDRAIALYAQALQRDPNFALAAARMAQVRLGQHWYVAPLNATELRHLRATIDHALSVAPDLGAAHVALGSFYYYGAREYDNAIAEYSRALQLQPNDASALQFRGYIYRRQGKWEESTTELKKAAELDPRDANLPENIAVTYLSLREWNEARRGALRSLALEPQSVLAQRVLALVYINGDGDLHAAAQFLKEIEPGRRQRVNPAAGTVSSIVGERAYVAVMQKDFDAAFGGWERDTSDPSKRLDRLAARAAISVLAGNAASHLPESEEARRLLEAQLQERSDDRIAMLQLSWAYLALGRQQDAIRMAEAAARTLPIQIDHLAGPIFATGLAEVEARGGDPKRAIAALRDLLAMPAGPAVSIARLKLDPVWDPIRNDPEFQQLLAGKELIGPNK